METKENKKLKTILKLIVFFLLIINTISIGALISTTFGKVEGDWVDLKVNLNEGNYADLEWNVYGPDEETGDVVDKSDKYIYRIYKKVKEEDSFQTVGAFDFESEEKIKVLNVYPGVGNALKTWMETNEFGRGLIEVDEVNLSVFNSNPTEYLGTPGNWKYDTVYFGTWDRNNGQDLSYDASTLVEQFIESGRGAIFGHDTIATSGGDLQHPNFASLARYVNIVMGCSWDSGEGNTQVVIRKKGIFTTFPWNIGEEGTILNTPYSHPLDQTANGTIWLSYANRNSTNHNFYLTTWNNCAMIQTGHSNAEATSDEQKILANLIYYTKQITIFTKIKEHSGLDASSPNTVDNIKAEVNEDNTVAITFDTPEDIGTQYTYYIEATNNYTLEKINSNEVQVEVKTGIQGYSYVIDENKTISKDDMPNEVMVTEPRIDLNDIDFSKDNYLHIVTIDDAGNKSEVKTLKITNKYKIQVTVLEDDTENLVTEGTFEVTSIDGEGNISKRDVEVNDNGIIEIEDLIKSNKTVKYIITPKDISKEYKTDAILEVKVQTDDYAVISVEDEEDTTVDNNEKIVTSKLYLQRRMIKFEIEKVDSQNTNIKLPGVVFTIDGEEFVTDENGKIILEKPILNNENIWTYQKYLSCGFQIEEKEAPAGYEGLLNVSDSATWQNVSLSFDENGNISQVSSLNDWLQCVNQEGDTVYLQAVNTKQQVENPITIQLESVDSKDNSKKLSGVKYKLELEADSGERFVLEQETDGNGQIKINDLGPIGNVRIKITQIDDVYGYKKNIVPLYVTVNRDNEGNLADVEGGTFGNIKKEIDDHILELTIPNDPKEEKNRIEITLQESDDITIEDFQFTLKDEHGNVIQTERTNEDGKLLFTNLPALTNGINTFIIEPQASDIYRIWKTKIFVNCDEKGKIASVEHNTSFIEEAKVEQSEDDIMIYTDAKLKMVVENISPTQTIKLEKIDKDDGTPIGGVVYKIKQISPTNIKTIKKATNAQGEIELDVIRSENVVLKIIELKSKDGYILDKAEKTVKLILNNDTNRLEVNEEESNLNIRDKNGTIIITDTNLRKISPQNAKKGQIDFFITKKDLDGNLLGKVQFALVETTTNTVYDLETDENGYVELKSFPVPGEGTYEFWFTEKNTVTGYILPSPIKLVISYEEIDGELKTTEIVVTKGYRLIDSKKCLEYEKDDTYQLDVIMTIRNVPNTIGTESLNLIKVDRETGEKLEGSIYSAKVEYSNGTSIKREGTLSELSKYFRKLYIDEGETVKIILKEIKAPLVYKLDSGEKVIEVKKENGEVTILSSTAHNANYTDSTINIQLADDKLKPNSENPGGIDEPEPGPGGTDEPGPGPGPGDPGTGVVNPPAPTPEDGEWADPGYDVIVINENIYNNKLRLEGSVFNLKVEKDSGIIYDQTSGIPGRLALPGTVNKAFFGKIYIDGTQQIQIKQTVAPLHHTLNQELYKIDIQRDARHGKIQLANKSHDDLEVSIDETNRVITVVIKNEPAEFIMAINKVDAEDNTIGLANVKFETAIYRDETAADLRTHEFITTDYNGWGYEDVSTFVTSGTGLYTLREMNTPMGYYANGTAGIYITTDENGNITGASLADYNGFAVFDTKHYTITKFEGKYIELKVTNDRIPGPTYSVIIDKKNKNHKIVKESGAKFSVQIEQEYGATVYKELTTNGNGIDVISGLNGTGKIRITAIQTEAGAWYILDPEPKVIEINRNVVQTVDAEGNRYDKKIELTNKTPTDTNVAINNENQEVVIEALNERIYGIEIIKMYYMGGKTGIYLPGAEFAIYDGDEKVAEVTTDKNGNAFIPLGIAPINTTQTFTLKETKAPNGYKTTGDWQITIKFDKSGTVVPKKSEMSGPHLIKESDFGCSFGTNSATIMIDEPKDSNTLPLEENDNTTFILEKQGINNKKLKMEKVLFKIYVESEETSMCFVQSTDSSGQIKIPNIPGNKVTIKLQELETVNGFVIDDKERTIVLEKKVENEKSILKLNKEETTQGLNLSIDEDSRIAELTFTNSISEQFMGIGIVKEDAEDELISIKDAVYEIKDEETKEVYTVKTGNEGMGCLILNAKKQPGTYNFTIKEIKAPEGYSLNEEEIKLQVTVELDTAGVPYIKTAKFEEESSLIELQNQDKNYVEVHIRNNPEDNLPEPYNIKIIKVDIDDINIRLPEAVLKIDVQNSIGQTGLSKTDIADGDGEININNVRGAGDVQIDITEIVPPPNRKFDSKPKQARLTKDPKTARIKLVNSLNVDTVIDNKNKLVKIFVRNEPIDGLYSMVIKKINENNVALGNVKMKVLLPGERNAREVITDEDGRIELLDLPMPSTGNYIYEIKEIEPQEGYKSMEEGIELKSTVTKGIFGNEIENVKVQSGTQYAKITKVTDKYFSAEIVNKKENLEDYKLEDYKIVLTKMDEKENVPLENAKIKLTIKYENGETQTIETVTDEKGQIKLEGLVIDGNAKITVEEIEAPRGYDLDTLPKSMKINITEEKQIEVLQKSTDLETEIKDRELDILLRNDREKEYINLHLEKFISKINDKNVDRQPVVEKTEDGFNYKRAEGREKVSFEDLVEYTIRVYNEGTNGAYAKTIKENIPEGLEFIEDNAINKANGWKQVEGKVYETNILSFEENVDNMIRGYTEEKEISYKDVKIVLKVVQKTDNNALTKNIAVIQEIEDATGKPVDEINVYKPDNEGTEELDIEYIDLNVEKKVKSIYVNENGITRQINVKENSIPKIEVDAKKVDNTQIEVEYEIKVTNTGTKQAELSKIIDYLPEKMTVVKEKSTGWDENGIYNKTVEVKPGESITKTIVLQVNGDTFGTKENVAGVEISGKIIGSTKSNKANIVISVKTGIKPVYITISIVSLGALFAGTYFIRKKII